VVKKTVIRTLKLADLRVAVMAGRSEVSHRYKIYADGTTPDMDVRVSQPSTTWVTGCGIWLEDGTHLATVKLPTRPGLPGEPFTIPGQMCFDLRVFLRSAGFEL